MPDNPELRPLYFSFPTLIYFSQLLASAVAKAISVGEKREEKCSISKLVPLAGEAESVERPRLRLSDYQNTVNPFPRLHLLFITLLLAALANALTIEMIKNTLFSVDLYLHFSLSPNFYICDPDSYRVICNIYIFSVSSSWERVGVL